MPGSVIKDIGLSSLWRPAGQRQDYYWLMSLVMEMYPPPKT